MGGFCLKINMMAWSDPDQTDTASESVKDDLDLVLLILSRQKAGGGIELDVAISKVLSLNLGEIKKTAEPYQGLAPREPIPAPFDCDSPVSPRAPFPVRAGHLGKRCEEKQGLVRRDIEAGGTQGPRCASRRVGQGLCRKGPMNADRADVAERMMISLHPWSGSAN
jgi:hypothetical protein